MSFFTKFLVFILGLAVLAVAAAWIMGGESTKNSTRISIKARKSTVFQYLVDGEKIKQWGKDVVSAGTFENEDSMSQERVVLSDGKETVWQDSLMRFQPGVTVSVQSKQGGLTRTFVFNLDENEIGGTNIEYRLTESASGLEQFMFPFKENNSRIEMEGELTRLKELIESEVDLESELEAEDDELPVVASANNDDNDGSDEPTQGSTNSSRMSAVDQVLGAEYSNKREPVDGKRNFESLFGTGG